MREVEDSDYEIPSGLTAQLRGYQKTGFRWLLTLSHYGFGGILADDMGLGKTLQMIAMLQSVMELPDYDSAASTSLIVCPASLVYNWESEFAKFAPKVRTRLVVGNASERRKLMRNLKQVDVIVTSYDLLKRDLELYEGKQFLYMVIDEAQYIKNASTQVARAVKSIGAAHRFALTGTPVENRLSDLWSIFDFVMKGYLYSYEKFRKNFEQPIVAERDEEVLRRLQRLTSPFILRRRKKDVLKDLPDKIEQVVYTTMTDDQRKLYNARFLKLKRELAGKSDAQFREDKMKVLAELTRLRQLCCDPALFVEGYAQGAGKVDAAIDMMEELVGNGSNILVFSQFATMLEILRDRLDEQGIHTLLLTGQNSKEERRNMVAEFQEGQQTVFLISLKAGGTGLNLTAADTVIHFDPWWNVAAQNQATDRAHRIGQDKVVTVIQLVMKNSIEERIIDLQNRKKELVEDVVEGDGVASASLTKEEILGLLEEF
jgi:SNF2 family DNA or RNA helicase